MSFRSLAELFFVEDNVEKGYQNSTQENKVTEDSKEQGVKYKEQEIANLKKLTSEVTSVRDSANSELSDEVQYLAKLYDMCVPKAEEQESANLKKLASELPVSGTHRTPSCPSWCSTSPRCTTCELQRRTAKISGLKETSKASVRSDSPHSSNWRCAWATEPVGRERLGFAGCAMR